MANVPLRISMASKGSRYRCDLEVTSNDASILNTQKDTVLGDFNTSCAGDRKLRELVKECHSNQSVAHEHAIVYRARKSAEWAAKMTFGSGCTFTSGPNPSREYKAVEDDKLFSPIEGV